eukprot:comp19586_c0_seq1/m.23043 comp19586_c0_seq1/g.23043  ORF comp19586_c0_seq1/g.23043 comp19586_c0_seq1/m.23043 type:complete len:373 (-) comp19586_c0_seq1:268-1386(-)
MKMAEEGSLQVGRTQLHLGPGTFLEALYEEEENPANTNFYDGRVISEDPDTATYVVKFDDGDRDTNCIEWKLRPIDVVEWGYLSIGSDVRARWKKDRYYYDAKIVGENVNKKEYDIMFVEDLKRLKGIKCSELRYSSTLTTEEIVPDMIVMVQWSQYKYGPGKVISKTNKSSKEENNMTVIEKLTEIKFHVINNDSEIKECPVYQLSRIYGFVPRTYLGERDDKCSECRKGEDLDEKLKKSVTCTWCKHVWHLACIKLAKEKARAQEPISDGSKWFCPTCTKQGKMKARRRLLTPLQALPGLLEPIGETIDDGNGHKYAVVGVPEPASSGQKRSADDGYGSGKKGHSEIGRQAKRGGLAASAARKGRTAPLK